MGLEETDTFFIVMMSFLALSGVCYLFFYKSTDDNFTNKLKLLKLSVILGGAFFIIMFAMMPYISAFKYPYEPTDVDSPEKVLKYLQSQSETLDRLIDIVKYSLVIAGGWIMASGYQFLKALEQHSKEEKAARNENNIS